MPKKKKSDEENSVKKNKTPKQEKPDEKISQEELDLEKLLQFTDEEEPSQRLSFDEFRPQNFFPAETSAPVLEEVGGQQELGGRIFFTPGMDASLHDDDKETNYSSNQYKNQGEGKYDEAPKNFEQGVSVGTSSDFGIASGNRNPRSQEFIFTTPESQGMQKNIQNQNSNYSQPKRFEQKNEGTPMEQDSKRKYQP